MARDFPAFLFYPEDFTTGTAEMSPLEVGVYIRCLCHQWHKLFVPDDAVKVGRIAGASSEEMLSAWPAVREKFKECGDGQLKNQRLERIRADLKKSTRIRSASGKAGAAARWKDDKPNGKVDGKHDADEMANASQSDSKNIASRVGNGDVNGTAHSIRDEDGNEDEFELFWSAFPSGRKKTKGRARQAFEKAKKKAGSPALIAAAAEYAASDEGRGQFVKMPETWLNGECWNDDREAWREHGGKRDNSTIGKGSGNRGL